MTLQYIIEFNLAVNSLQDKSALQYNIQLIDWNSQGIKLFFNFTNPTLVSSGTNFDVMNIVVLNGSYFVSANGNLSMNEAIFGNNYI